MRRHGIVLRTAGLALVALLAIVLWKSARLSDGGASARTRENNPAVVSAGKKEFARPAVETAEGKSAKTAEEVSTEILRAFVAARVREWEADDNPELRDQRTHDLETVLAGGGRTISERLKLIETLPDRLMDFAFGLPSFQQWMFSEPNAALDWMQAHPGISEARVLSLFQDWTQHDRPAVARYLEQLPEDAWKQKAMLAATHAAMSDDPVTAIAYARQLNPDEQRNGLLEMATTEWARREPEAAGRWVEQVRDPALRTPLIGSLLVGYAEFAPDLAAQWATDTLPPGKILDRTVAEIGLAWARQEPSDRSSK
jgi:hypothetical protein